MAHFANRSLAFRPGLSKNSHSQTIMAPASTPIANPRFVIRDFVIRYSLITLSFTAAFAFALACFLIAGNSLDLFIGSIFLAAILASPCSAIAGRLPDALLSAVSSTLGFVACWLVAVYDQAISLKQWLICTLVLLSLLALLMSAVRILMRARLSPATSSAIVTAAVLLWLSWPVWLSASLAGAHLHYSIAFHPLFAINQTLSNLGIWTEQQVAYNLTNFGQDVQYQLPDSAWPAIGLQSVVAILLCGLSCSGATLTATAGTPLRLNPKTESQSDSDMPRPY